MGVAWLFPGQGSQTVGMGRELAERYPSAMRAFDEASDAIGIDLQKLAWDGPQADLDRTANTQPALLTASIAALRAAQESGPLASRSRTLGPLARLIHRARGRRALSLADAVRLVRKAASSCRQGSSCGMLAVTTRRRRDREREDRGNGHGPSRTTRAGSGRDQRTARRLRASDPSLKDAGAKRVIPFGRQPHSTHLAMPPPPPRISRRPCRHAVGRLRLTVIANVDAKAHEHAADFRNCSQNRCGLRYSGRLDAARGRGGRDRLRRVRPRQCPDRPREANPPGRPHSQRVRREDFRGGASCPSTKF